MKNQLLNCIKIEDIQNGQCFCRLFDDNIYFKLDDNFFCLDTLEKITIDDRKVLIGLGRISHSFNVKTTRSGMNGKLSKAWNEFIGELRDVDCLDVGILKQEKRNFQKMIRCEKCT